MKTQLSRLVLRSKPQGWALACLMMLACLLVSVTADAAPALVVHTSFSEPVFMAPVDPADRRVYLGIRNTSDYRALEIEPALAHALAERGYRIVSSPDSAQFVLQINVSQAGFCRSVCEGTASSSTASIVYGTSPGGQTSTYAGGIPIGLLTQVPQDAAASFGRLFHTERRIFTLGLEIRLIERVMAESSGEQSEDSAAGFRIHDFRETVSVENGQRDAALMAQTLTEQIAHSLANLFE